MVHGTLHLGVGDGYIVRLIGERTIRHGTRIDSSPRSRVQGQIDGRVSGDVSVYSPVGDLPEIWGRRKTSRYGILTIGRIKDRTFLMKDEAWKN